MTHGCGPLGLYHLPVPGNYMRSLQETLLHQYCSCSPFIDFWPLYLLVPNIEYIATCFPATCILFGTVTVTMHGLPMFVLLLLLGAILSIIAIRWG